MRLGQSILICSLFLIGPRDFNHMHCWGQMLICGIQHYISYCLPVVLYVIILLYYVCMCVCMCMCMRVVYDTVLHSNAYSGS